MSHGTFGFTERLTMAHPWGAFRARSSALVLPAILIALLIGVAPCGWLLEVEDREVLSPAHVDVDLLVAGAIRDFTVAYSGSGANFTTWDRILSTSGLLTDELVFSGAGTRPAATDQRDQLAMELGNFSDQAYVALHQARRAAIRAFRALVNAGLGSGTEAAFMKVIEGFSYVALGENFCAGIPFGEVHADGTRSFGMPLGIRDVLEGAVARFDEALSIDSENSTARVGKGRALLNLGRYPEAAAAVSAVPTSFLANLHHSDNSPEQHNPIFKLQEEGRVSMSDREGGNGLPYRSAGDPRIPWIEDPKGGFDPSSRLFLVQKYSENRSAPVVLADGVEARLIEAEAALNEGEFTAWLAILNALRVDVATLMAARVPGYESLVPGPNNPTTTLAPLTDPGTEAARVDLMFGERAFWMYLTGHRLGDLRRLVRQYGRSSESVFPTGAYHRGGVYGGDVAMPLDFAETNNPNYSVDLCVYTSP